MSRATLSFATLCLAIAPAVGAGEVPPERPRPRVAVALSGGGARGIAHIGALRALEEAGIPVDAIAANSVGAVVGGHLRHWEECFGAGGDRPVVGLGVALQRAARPADAAGRPEAGPLRLDRRGQLRLEEGPPACRSPGRPPREPFPDREPLAGGVRGRGRLRPPRHHVPCDGGRPRHRGARGPGEGRPRAGGPGQHVHPARLPPGRVGGQEARGRHDRQQPADRRGEGLRPRRGRRHRHRQPAARPGGLPVVARGGLAGERLAHPAPLPGLRGRGGRARPPGPRRPLGGRLLTASTSSSRRATRPRRPASPPSARSSRRPAWKTSRAVPRSRRGPRSRARGSPPCGSKATSG